MSDILSKAREIPRGIGGYHHDIVQEMISEIERLRAELARNADEFRETLTELRQRVETITAERDVTRREVCARFAMIYSMTVQEVEKLRGWDCFKEPAHAP